ncbi:MFS transporter [Brachybacterium phenoliresistens]|uniref:Putative proline/betaine transporter n=1 Tax=Brachybacterium phenoliresistens TaxID=396014 RepID=Z9JRR3_9MICO|nr:MFS transporter [Brachybacterium phenoliresistens]EWS80718.1 major facilitator transporter [Brachybacterium phenoliresistens]
MSITESPTPPVAPANTRGRVITASMVGTTIEFFDFYAYATAASLVFPALFFPTQSPANQLLSSFAIFGVAFVARPLGSLVFGHYGDRVGRKTTLVASLLVMGIATFLIGVLPTAQTPGFTILAPAILVLLRFCQGVGLGGEWSGAALLATENAPPGKRALYGTFPQLGAPLGFILSNLLFVGLSLGLSDAQFTSWGWRVPFLLSAVLVIVGLWVRLKLMESPAFQKVIDEERVAAVPIARVFRRSWKPLVLATFAMVATYVLFYMMTAFLMVVGTTPADEGTARAAAEAAGKSFDAASFAPGLGFARPQFLTMLIIGVVFFGIFTVVSGPLADRLGRRRLLLAVTAGIGVFGLLLEPLMRSGTVGVMAALILGFALMGMTFGPMAAFLPEMFTADVRYTGSAVSYNLASVIGAAPAPYAMIALWQALGGPLWLVGGYLLLAAVITIVALLLGTETREVDYLA